MKARRVGTLSAGARILLILFPVAAALTALVIGRITVPPREVLHAVANLFGGKYDVPLQTEKVLWTFRAPRILLALLVGAGLSAAGCAFQSLFSNPLATPDTLGVASGSSFGAALAILLGMGMLGVQLTAMAFGAAAVGLTFITGSGRGRGPSSIVLAGIMIGSLFTALVSLVKYTADAESKLPEITYFLMGSLNGRGYDTLALGAPLILIGIAVLYLLRWRMNLLPLPDDEARASGTNMTALRAATVICATAVTAACVSMCGQVGWIGLLVPHACRMKFGSNHLSLIPASVCVGAGFMVLVDTVARSASAAEIPVSILTAIIGAPFFIGLMRKTGGWRL